MRNIYIERNIMVSGSYFFVDIGLRGMWCCRPITMVTGGRGGGVRVTIIEIINALLLSFS